MRCKNDCFNCDLPECIFDDPKNINAHIYPDTGKCKGIGKRLKKALKDKGIKQKQLADMLNITEASISQYITEIRPPKCEHIIAICNILEISSDWLLGLDIEEDKQNDKKQQDL